MRNRKIKTFAEKRPRRTTQIPVGDLSPSADLLAIRVFREIRKYVEETDRPAPETDIIKAADIGESLWPKVEKRLLSLGLAVKSRASEWTPAFSLDGGLASRIEQMPEWPFFTRVAPREMRMSAAQLREILKALEKSENLRAIPLPGQRGAWAVTRQHVSLAGKKAKEKAKERVESGGKRLDDLFERGAVFVIGALTKGPLRAVDLSKRAAQAGVERPTTASGFFAALIRAGLIVPLPRATRLSHGSRRSAESARVVGEHAKWALSADGLAAAAAMNFRAWANPDDAVCVDRMIENTASAA